MRRHRPDTSGDRDDDLLQRAGIRLQLLRPARHPIELKNVGDDVDIRLVIQTSCVSQRHGTANLLKPIRERLALPAEFERSLCQVARLRIGAVEIFPMTACALGLESTLAAFRLFGRKYPACGRSRAGRLSGSCGHSEHQTQTADREPPLQCGDSPGHTLVWT